MAPPRLEQEPRKNISICLSVEPSEYQEMLHDICGADAIYSKEFNGGTLYLLYHPSPQKMHSTMDSALCYLEETLKTAASPEDKFQKISDFKSGKVKTFKRSEHMLDEHYTAVFDSVAVVIAKKPKVKPGVGVWTCERVGRAIYKRASSKKSRKRSQAKAEKRALHVSSKLQALAKKAQETSMKRAQNRLTRAEEDYRKAEALAKKVLAKLDKATAATARSVAKLRKAEDKFDTAASMAMC